MQASLSCSSCIGMLTDGNDVLKPKSEGDHLMHSCCIGWKCTWCHCTVHAASQTCRMFLPFPNRLQVTCRKLLPAIIERSAFTIRCLVSGAA